MMRAFFAVAVLLILAAVLPAQAQAPQSPPSAFGSATQRQAPPPAFAGPKNSAQARDVPDRAAPLQAQGRFGAVLTWIAQTQQKMQRQLAGTIKGLKSGNAWGAGLWLAGLSFVYGIVHAAGPGHGKAIISSYVLANRETVRRGVLISFLAAAVQGLMAVLLVGILIVALKGTGFQVNAWVMQLETASYALVFLVGLSLLVSTLMRLWRRRGKAGAGEGHDHAHHHHHHHHHHDHSHDHDPHDPEHAHEHCETCGHIVDARDIAQPMTWQKILAVVVSVGIRPCSGAVLVLVFALAQGLFWAGVASTFAMALGTAITVSVLASMAIGSRKLALAAGSGNERWTEAVWTACAIGGALLVMTMGLLLFLASLGPARPF
ncbi:nickel/cobalt transporter [Methyloceanibacter sp.]|uniref:nickel/cobalt transporter n=1 Tax=Methyloceanibacter sp. TaxID=1965321 RepID=UPI002CC25EAB|nr:nickel/cobalt transporter [Methyloceanibacter sp.]HML93591.1 nickel/cobalt transporter [Methyloceanibacter sp.]